MIQLVSNPINKYVVASYTEGLEFNQAGNIWSINNWKPDFDIDILSNPGGDGIIIFVGLAAPPRPAH